MVRDDDGPLDHLRPPTSPAPPDLPKPDHRSDGLGERGGELFVHPRGVACLYGGPYLFGHLADAAGFRAAMASVAVPAVIYGLISRLIRARAGLDD